MSSNRRINEPTGVNPKAIIARWLPIGGCAGVTGTARVGTTGKLVMTCGAGTVTNIAIATRIAVDTAIETIRKIEAGIARIETIEAPMRIGLGVA